MRDVAQAVGITERAVKQIVAELVGQEYLRKEKVDPQAGRAPSSTSPRIRDP